jgi:hypothetical protein
MATPFRGGPRDPAGNRDLTTDKLWFGTYWQLVLLFHGVWDMGATLEIGDGETASPIFWQGIATRESKERERLTEGGIWVTKRGEHHLGL